MHTVRQYRVALPGIEAVSLVSKRHFPRHSHDQLGIGVITSGGHRSWSSVGSVEAVCGDTIMVNPGEMHDGSPLEGQKPRCWSMLFFEPELAYGIPGEECRGSAITLLPTVRDRGQFVRFNDLFTAVTDPRPDALRIEECLMRTLLYAFQHHGTQRPFRLSALPNVGKVIKLLDSEPEKPRSLQDLARTAGVSRFHFLRAFARATGTTPHAYIVQRRVQLARRLLSAGREIGQASAEAGFADQSHMTRAFVRQLGVTPARFRQAVRGARK